MKKLIYYLGPIALLLFFAGTGLAAYHHEGEKDADKLLSVYPEKAGTKLDHCALCHTGGQYEKKPGKWTSLGSCQWCHYSYGYDGAGDIKETMNQFGLDYKANGRNADAIKAIVSADWDSDRDGYSNLAEINANRFPGNAADDPSKIPAPFRVYTRDQLAAMPQHTQFLLLNTSRSGDFYAQYTGVPMEDLLADAGILDKANGITAYAPDGWAQYHPLEQDEAPELYHVNGLYPSASYYYNEEADQDINPDGWCDYSAPSCKGRNDGDNISNPDGLKMILALKREGEAMDPGILTEDNKLDGEGPYRIVPPQKNPRPPDQSSTAENQAVIWPYDYDLDHNAGSAARTVTIIKVEPLPEGTTDIDVLEAGWNYVDQSKVIIYGAIDPTDTNGNGILDSEEKGQDPASDLDGDGTQDWKDPDTAKLKCAEGGKEMSMFAKGNNLALSNVQSLSNDDPAVPQTGKPDIPFPYGVLHFEVNGVASGATVVVTLVFPENISTSATYYKVSVANGWQEIPFGDNDGDNTITLSLTDGDPETDADGVANGTIVDPGALGVPAGSSAVAGDGGGGSGCFITSAW